jgi:uncharacterized repeat protein (TIGR03803 family)
MTKSNYWKRIYTVILISAAAASGQNLTTLANFNGTDGWQAEGALVQGADGSLYGTTYLGGYLHCNGTGCGTVYKFTPDGKLITLYVFCNNTFPNCPDGANPSGLTQAIDGNFYGTTFGGGPGSSCRENTINGCGTVFKITPAGEFKTLYTFCAQPNCSDGAEPLGGLIQAANGDFYGTTELGGASTDTSYSTSYGTVFKITTMGKLTTLHRFHGSDGADPTTLIQATDGNFYGTTYDGGAYGKVKPGDSGTVFKITPAGTLTTLYSFCGQVRCPDGSVPNSLVQGIDGNFYGSTMNDGVNDVGTIFEITPGGELTTLHTFCSIQPYCADGAIPEGVIQATDGNFYGATRSNGVNGWGTVFAITAEGTLTTLYSFNGFDGAIPGANLLQATNGNFYGTTTGGGTYTVGTLFGLSMGLGQFVKTLPAAAKVGAEIGVLGTQLTEASSVTLNGIPARFSVRSASLILATIPSGATTGYLTVTTPSGMLTSNAPFYIVP